MRVLQALTDASPHDASTMAALRLRTSVPADRRGDLYAVTIDPSLAGDVRPLRELADADRDDGTVVLVHMSLGCPELVDAVLGDYRGGPWDPRADVWVILARKK